MNRVVAVWTCVALCAAAGTAGQAQRGSASPNPQLALRVDLDGMTARVAAGPGSARQARADAQRLAVGYRGFGPLVGALGPADYALNRQMARRSLVWLGRSSLWYRTDPLVTRAYLDAYDSIGAFYRGHGGWYYPGAYVAYAGATRLARRLAMASLYDWSQREFDRYALAYGALAVANGTLVGRWTLPSDLAEGAAAAPAPPQLKPVEMPRVDTAAMSADERAAYLDVRDRFRSVSAHVQLVAGAARSAVCTAARHEVGAASRERGDRSQDAGVSRGRRRARAEPGNSRRQPTISGGPTLSARNSRA